MDMKKQKEELSAKRVAEIDRTKRQRLSLEMVRALVKKESRKGVLSMIEAKRALEAIDKLDHHTMVVLSQQQENHRIREKRNGK
ncbi:hypothetical protein [Acinetobacter phage ABPH49]|nr:hypothetical protein [Acinetobacter phage ABPH49]